MWKNKNICLRYVELADLQHLLLWENNPENWVYGDNQSPYSEEEMIDFIVEQMDFRKTNQLRLMICLNETKLPIGMIDLFAIDIEKKEASIGIIIAEKKYRRNHYASESIELIKEIATELFSVQTLNCIIQDDNISSIKLFEKNGFELVKKGTHLMYYQLKLSI